MVALLALAFSLFEPALFVDSGSLCYCCSGTVILRSFDVTVHMATDPTAAAAAPALYVHFSID